MRPAAAAGNAHEFIPENSIRAHPRLDQTPAKS